jgi:hypothetical protein
MSESAINNMVAMIAPVPNSAITFLTLSPSIRTRSLQSLTTGELPLRRPRREQVGRPPTGSGLDSSAGASTAC